MSQELTTNGRHESLTAQTANYIHNVAEIEKDIYTMEQLEKELETKSDSLKQEFISVGISKPTPGEIEVPYEKPIYDRKLRFNFDFWDINFKLCFTLWPVIFLVGCLINTVYREYGDSLNWTFSNPSAVNVILLIVFSLGFIVNMVINSVWLLIIRPIKHFIGYNSDYKRRCKIVEEWNNDLERINRNIKEQYEEDCQEYNKECERVNKHNKEIKNKILLVEKQTELIRQRKKELEELRRQIYSVGIIPPDYRTMDCVYGLDHIFRNQLADTVREAILQYEDRVFKGQVVKGLNNILSRLHYLGTQMDYLINDIHSINNHVQFISQDISNLADAQSRNQKTLNSILEESKATRYANEAIKKHSEEIKKYLDDARK